MAKSNYTLTFSKAYIDVDENIITEVTKDATFVHNLEKTLKDLEGKELNISFKETNELFPQTQSEE